MQTRRIPIKEINFDDDTFLLIPPGQQTIPADLEQSIKRTGILHPPIVREITEKSFQIISGKKRLLIMQKSGVISCDCLMMPTSASTLDGLAIALEEIIISRKINPLERALFFQKVLKEIEINEAAKRFLPLLGFSAQPGLIQRCIALLNLEDPLVAALYRDDLDEKVALELGKLYFGDRMALFEVITFLQLSVGNQKKLTISCRELSIRGNTSIRQVLSDPEAEAILNHPEANRPQKARNLMAWINRQRFPRLTEAEKEFRHLCGGLHLPKEISLSHSPSFEKDELTLSITIQNQAALKKLYPKLADILGQQE